MGKVGKTFTCDVQVLVWLEQFAKKQKKKESAIVNAMLAEAKRQSEIWVCSFSQRRSEAKCWATKDCEGVPTLI
jgi:hypothetical protein